MGNPVQTCWDSGQPSADLPEHPAYHRSFHRPGPAGHGAALAHALADRPATESPRRELPPQPLPPALGGRAPRRPAEEGEQFPSRAPNG